MIAKLVLAIFFTDELVVVFLLQTLRLRKQNPFDPLKKLKNKSKIQFFWAVDVKVFVVVSLEAVINYIREGAERQSGGEGERGALKNLGDILWGYDIFEKKKMGHETFFRFVLKIA